MNTAFIQQVVFEKLESSPKKIYIKVNWFSCSVNKIPCRSLTNTFESKNKKLNSRSREEIKNNSNLC